jgi:dTMP kinase
MFFSFDGVDGTGKSTQMNLFCQWLTERGQTIVTCRDPGGTPLGEALRGILLDSRQELAISPMSEMLLYMASRAQLVEQVIVPALDAGKVVVSDRYLLANVVYQGHARGLDIAKLWEIGRFITHGVQPDVTFLLDMNPESAAKRIDRPLDRMELQGIEFQKKLRAGFLAEAAKQPDRIAVIDADRSIEAVQANICNTAQRYFRNT